MSRNKWFLIASILIAIIGLGFSNYANIRLEQKIDSLGKIANLVSFFKYSKTESTILIFMNSTGVVCGLIAFIKRKNAMVNY
ncbi:hypothetical protein HNQ88_001589 [Aureibacter tunicatorum]|uniref:Uncharacterized protein n=1 Tax=Aureibacter tunicatorum TaxID=866807 RepID=A0AAE3XLB4_9BACT|nr:hypothetical protein [Aureibacter tunicatorum]BDD05517.1 hypothetical protein AUTU_30000 [Aureibacter tunicatorum]